MKLIGIGKGASGKGHVHAIREGNSALCDKRTINLVVDKKLKNADVTCPKCAKHSLVTGTATVPAKKKTPAKSKPTTKKAKQDNHFVAGQKKNSCYRIHHVPSGKDFFDNIDERVALIALEDLNNMDQKWEKGEALPENFIYNCRMIVKDSYKKIKIRPPEHLTKKLRKQKKKKPKKGDRQRFAVTADPKAKKKVYEVRVFDGKEWIPEKEWNQIQESLKKKTKTKIRRRQRKAEKAEKAAKPKRTIRRRENKNQYGQTLGKPPAILAEMLEEGYTLRHYLAALINQFGFSSSEAMSKFKGFIRKHVRKRGVIVTHIMAGTEQLDDYYAVAAEETQDVFKGKKPEKSKTKIRRRKK